MNDEPLSPLARSFDALYGRLYNLITGRPDLVDDGAPALTSGPVPSSAQKVEIPALRRLSEIFNLSPFACDILVLSAAAELDGRFPAAFAQLQGAARAFPTYMLALTLSDNVDSAALGDSSPLRYWHLLDIPIAETLSLSPLRIAPRILQYLLGNEDVEADVLATILPWSASALTQTQDELAAECTLLWARTVADLPVVQLVGAYPAQKREIMRRALENAGLRAVLVSAGALPHDSVALNRTIRLWLRELRLGYDAVVFDCEEPLGNAARQSVIRTIAALAPFAPVAVLAQHPLELDGIVTIVKRNPPLTALDRRVVWEAVLGDAASSFNGALEELARFEFSPEQIRGVTLGALATIPAGAEPATMFEALHAACRERASGDPETQDL